MSLPPEILPDTYTEHDDRDPSTLPKLEDATTITSDDGSMMGLLLQIDGKAVEIAVDPRQMGLLLTLFTRTQENASTKRRQLGTLEAVDEKLTRVNLPPRQVLDFQTGLYLEQDPPQIAAHLKFADGEVLATLPANLASALSSSLHKSVQNWQEHQKPRN